MRQPALWREIDFASVPGRAERVTDEVLLEVSTDSGLDSSVPGLGVPISREHSLVDTNFFPPESHECRSLSSADVTTSSFDIISL